MFKRPRNLFLNRRESCAAGCLVILGAMLGLWVTLVLLNDFRFLKEQPAEAEILGRWHVTEISGPVSHWLAQGGNAVRTGTHMQTSPAEDNSETERKANGLDHGWIEFLPRGKVTSHALPWLLEGDTCYRVSDEGTWELKDLRDRDMAVKWKMQVTLHGFGQDLIFRKDGEGIYLGIPIDWEFIDSVVLRKSAERESK